MRAQDRHAQALRKGFGSPLFQNRQVGQVTDRWQLIDDVVLQNPRFLAYKRIPTFMKIHFSA